MVHSVTRGWQDIWVLLGVMGYMQSPIPCPMEGCPVTSSIDIAPSFTKNLPQKAQGSPLLGQYLRSVDCPVLYSGAHEPYPPRHLCAYYAISQSRGHGQNDGHTGPDVRRPPHCRRGGRMV